MKRTIIEVQNPIWANEEQTAVNLEVKFKEIVLNGESVFMPFTASPDDTEQHGIELYNNALNGDYGEIQPFVVAPETVTQHIDTYRDERAVNFPYKTTVMQLTDGARADLTATYYAVVLNTSIPDEQVMMVWQEKGYDDLPITAGDLRADGLTFMAHRQKCFTAAATVKATHEQTPYESKAAIEAAFDAVYDSL